MLIQQESLTTGASSGRGGSGSPCGSTSSCDAACARLAPRRMLMAFLRLGAAERLEAKAPLPCAPEPSARNGIAPEGGRARCDCEAEGSEAEKWAMDEEPKPTLLDCFRAMETFRLKLRALRCGVRVGVGSGVIGEVEVEVTPHIHTPFFSLSPPPSLSHSHTNKHTHRLEGRSDSSRAVDASSPLMSSSSSSGVSCSMILRSSGL